MLSRLVLLQRRLDQEQRRLEGMIRHSENRWPRASSREKHSMIWQEMVQFGVVEDFEQEVVDAR